MKRAVILLTLGVFLAVSCDEKEPETDDVPLKLCNCEERADFTPSLLEIQYSEMDVYLFKDSIPKEMESDFYMSPHFVCWIIYFSETDDEILNHDVWMFFNRFYDRIDWDFIGLGRICNFPDFAKKITFPQNGVKVYVEGAMYNNCFGTVGSTYAFDYVLSKFKILD